MDQERLVASFRLHGVSASLEDSESFASSAESLVRRAESAGAELVAWHAASFAVAYPPGGLESLVELITSDECQSLGLSVGVAHGLLSWLGGSERMKLAWGPALVVAWALGRVARAGEVLFDPEMEAVRDERLLFRGSRIGVLGEARVRGARLDLRHPHKPARGFPTLALVRAPHHGRDPAAPPPGTLGLVAGVHGAGGTRWLEQLAAKERGRRTLWLRPRLGEALGALRRSLSQAKDAAPELGADLRSSLESVLLGEGLDLETSSALLSALLRREGVPGLVLVDDAELVDSDSLEAVAHACRSGAFALVARVSDELELPEPLGELAPAFETKLGPLDSENAVTLVSELTSGRVRSSEAGRWVKRGGALPLGMVGALGDALESGELESREVPGPGRLAALAPAELFARRIRRWDPRVRAVLGALAVLGGDSDQSELAAVLALFHEAAPDEVMLHGLEAADLVRRDDTRLTLTSATLRHALSESLSEAERARLHRAAAAVLAEGDLPLDAVASAVHSLLGGDVDRALPMLRRSAGALHAAGLEKTALAMEAVSVTGDPDPMRERGLFGGAHAGRAGLQRSDVPPPLSLHPPAERPSRSPPSAEQVAARFKQALKHGDHAAMEVLASELRDDGSQAAVADRLEGMAHLARGQVREALRRLERAKQATSSLAAGDRSRASLALGVALASAGRGTEALLEGLEALARAREAGDGRGERACARFLSQISLAAGSPDAAEKWAEIAKPG